MPPPGQKGKKGSNAARQSRSRNTTPSLSSGATTIQPQSTAADTAYLELPISSFRTFTAEELVEQHGSTIPSSKELEGLMERLTRLVEIVETRGSVCDKGMRLLAQARKDRLEELDSERRDEERKERLKRDAAAEEEERGRKANKLKKKNKDSSRHREERPLTHSAHGLVPQDGSNLEHSSPIRDPTIRKPARRMSRDNDSASSSLSPVAPATPTATGMDLDDKDDEAKGEDDSDSDERQPPPAPAIPHLQTFGDDPSTFPDPTIYEIRPVKPGMSEKEIKEIYSVADYPHHDLMDLIPGIPKDHDWSSQKPTNQVQANTFATYLEPYFRPFTEEDLAFLRERGDRTNAFVIPRRGKRHYHEVWAEEDGALSIDTPKQDRDKLPANQPRGDIENMDDSVAETDQISAGPLLSRLLATMRPEHRAPVSEPATNGVTNGDVTMNGDSNADLDAFFDAPAPPSPLPPAAFMKDSGSEAWKKASHPKLEYAHMDERIKQELRHIGFLPPDVEPDYDAHYDDEIAARLRLLQAQLKEQSIINGARKARLQDLTKERLAHQEYSTILEDLDGQVQTAYLKRTRTMGKSKKAKRPGGAGGGSHVAGPNGGLARPGIGDLTKMTMERRKRWIDAIGMVFDDEQGLGKVPKHTDPNSSIFKPEDLAEFVKKEKESWDEEADEE